MNQRPTSTIVIGILHLVCAALLSIIAITAFSRNQALNQFLGIVDLQSTALYVVATIAFVAAVAEVVAGVGAFNQSSWAWNLAFYTAVVIGAICLIVGILALAQASLLFAGLRLVIPFFLAGTLITGLAHALEIIYLLQPSTQSVLVVRPTISVEQSYVSITPALAPPTPTAPPSVTGPLPSRPVGRTQLVNPPEPPVGWLVLRNGGRAEPQALQRSNNVLGRDGQRSQIVLDDPSVSAEHAKIRFENGVFVVYDLASTNGTYVNGRRVEKQRLMDGDIIKLGKSEYVFKSVDPKRR